MKLGMRVNVNDDIQVARRTAGLSMFAFAVEAQALAVGDAGWHLHRDAAILRQSTRTATCRTRLGHELPGPVALRTRPRDDKESLLIANLSAAAALRTFLRRRSGCCAGSVAGPARLFARNLNRFFFTRERFFEWDFEIESEICAAHRTAAPGAAKPAAESKEVAEDVGEIREDVGIESGRAALTCDAGVTEAIVSLPFFCVAQHRVRFSRLFEFVFCPFVARVAIGMELERKLAIRALDVLF